MIIDHVWDFQPDFDDKEIYQGFPIGDTPIAGWFLIEHHIKMDDLGVPPF
jgi:hypothetical protein